MRFRGLGCVVLLGLIALPVGCKYVAAATYLFGPPQVQKAEFKLTDGRLVVLVEMVHPDQDNPVFRQALQDKLVEIFRDNKVRSKIVPEEEILRLRQQNRDFSRWSLQKVGQRLDARQVLYVRVERLQLREEAGSPLLSPLVVMRLKVVDPRAQADQARLWPGKSELDGREVERARPGLEAADTVAIDAEAAKLGKDAAYIVAMPFYDVDLEKKTPWEP
jgi:hypothetical protein